MEPLDAWDIHGCVDGFVLKFRGEVVDVFPHFADVAIARRRAIQAMAELSDTLAKKAA